MYLFRCNGEIPDIRVSGPLQVMSVVCQDLKLTYYDRALETAQDAENNTTVVQTNAADNFQYATTNVTRCAVVVK